MTEHDLVGTRVGRILITNLLGEGGMGSVYVGFDETLERRVALKAVQRGRLDENAKARFLREARVLSQLKHPNICQIYDYVEGPERDYLVLELIDGRNLKEVIASHPDPALKMRLARQIADVLVVTHAKGIIHRDLKPANVMLSREGEVKVLDFGLARGQAAPSPVITGTGEASPGAEVPLALGESVTLDTPTGQRYTDPGVTHLGTVLGTLSYMSPEQARGEAVTTASDMYSYGLVLQELFTERSAYAPAPSAADQLTKAVAGETLPVVGLDRDLTALINRLKDPAAAVRPTALDTVEWLARVEAKPRLRRRRALAWGAAAVLGLVAVGMSFLAWRIRQEATRANREAESTKEVSEFLVRVFEVSDPGENQGAKVTARELLDKAARDIEGRLNDQPLVKARLELTLARVYDSLGLYDPALSLAQKSLELRREHLPATDATLAESLHRLGSIRYDRGEYAQAVPVLKSAAEIQEKALGRESPALAGSLTALANVYGAQGNAAEAEPLYLRALQIREKVLGPEHADVAESLNDLAEIYRGQRKFTQAEPLYVRAIAIQEKALGPNHPDLAASLNNLALTYRAEGQFERAEPLSLRVVAINEKVLGPDHPNVAASLNNLAELYREQGKLTQAEPLYLRTIAILEKALGPNHPWLGGGLNNLALVYQAQEKYPQAETLYLRVIAIDEKAFGPENPALAPDLASLATVYRDERKYALAEPLYLRAIAISEKAGEQESTNVASSLVLLADLYQREGKPDEAGPLVVRSLRIYDKSPSKATSQRFSYVQALTLAGRTAEAQAKAKELLREGYRKKEFLKLCEELGVATGT